MCFLFTNQPLIIQFPSLVIFLTSLSSSCLAFLSPSSAYNLLIWFMCLCSHLTIWQRESSFPEKHTDIFVSNYMKTTQQCRPTQNHMSGCKLRQKRNYVLFLISGPVLQKFKQMWMNGAWVSSVMCEVWKTYTSLFHLERPQYRLTHTSKYIKGNLLMEL